MKAQALSHHKFRALHREISSLSTAHTAGYLELLWSHAHQAKVGPRIKRDDVEMICDWPGEQGVLVAALIKTRWLDVVDEATIEIHDYYDHAPDYVKRRDYQSDYMREYRKKNKANTRVVSGCKQSVSPNNTTVSGCKHAVSRPTKPNLTKPNLCTEEVTNVTDADASDEQASECAPVQGKLPGTQKTSWQNKAAATGLFHFHNAYPEHRRINPKIVLPLWLAALDSDGCPDATRAEIMAHLGEAVKSVEWTKEFGKFIPSEKRYLEEHLWRGRVNRNPFARVDSDEDEPAF